MFSFLPSIFLSGIASKSTSPEEAMADYVMRQDKKALELLYGAFADDLFHYLVTLSDVTLAKDIAQKTWVKVIEKPQNYHHGHNRSGSVKAWLFTMGRNALIDEFRKTNRWVSLSDERSQFKDGENATINISDIQQTGIHAWEQQDVLSNQEQSAICEQQAQTLQLAFDRALSNLAFEQKEAFCLQQEGFSLSEIATITGDKQETIKTRIRYAKTKLKQWMENTHE